MVDHKFANMPKLLDTYDRKELGMVVIFKWIEALSFRTKTFYTDFHCSVSSDSNKMFYLLILIHNNPYTYITFSNEFDFEENKIEEEI